MVVTLLLKMLLLIFTLVSNMKEPLSLHPLFGPSSTPLHYCLYVLLNNLYSNVPLKFGYCNNSVKRFNRAVVLADKYIERVCSIKLFMARWKQASFIGDKCGNDKSLKTKDRSFILTDGCNEFHGCTLLFGDRLHGIFSF